MTIEQCLATIDLLCGRPFPAEHGRSDAGIAGPGYHVTELEASAGPGTGDGADREVAADQFEACREALVGPLTARWGTADHIGLQTVLLRTGTEDIPEPWAGLSVRVNHIHLWQAQPAGRWIALGVADRDETDEVRLLVAVTEIDPP